MREQFRAVRLDIGMTEQEVEAVLKAKPIDSGELRAGTCKEYGGTEMFPIPNHFGNVVVEAMIRGLPVLVTQEVGAAKIVEASGCGVVTRSSQRDLAAAMWYACEGWHLRLGSACIRNKMPMADCLNRGKPGRAGVPKGFEQTGGERCATSTRQPD